TESSLTPTTIYTNDVVDNEADNYSNNNILNKQQHPQAQGLNITSTTLDSNNVAMNALTTPTTFTTFTFEQEEQQQQQSDNSTPEFTHDNNMIPLPSTISQEQQPTLNNTFPSDSTTTTSYIRQTQEPESDQPSQPPNEITMAENSSSSSTSSSIKQSQSQSRRVSFLDEITILPEYKVTNGNLASMRRMLKRVNVKNVVLGMGRVKRRGSGVDASSGSGSGSSSSSGSVSSVGGAGET
ncbi:hypothetical protein HDU76_007416, partial [Blyttiomyces sp. JEL0837]